MAGGNIYVGADEPPDTEGPDHSVAWEPVTPEPCGCDQSLALQRRLTVHETLLRGIREALETESVEDDAKRVSWIAAMVKLAHFNLEGLR